MGHLRISGRVDLLRALADVHGSDADAFAVEDMAALAALLDLHPQPPAAASVRIEGGGKLGAQAEGNAGDPVDDRAPTPAPGRRPPLRARFFVVLESSELPARASPQIAPSLTPLTAADCGPLNPNEPPPIPPLVPRTRLWPALRRSLSPARSGGVDVPALTRRLSRAESIRRLPHATRHRAVGEVWVVFDIAQRLIPYEQDFADIIDEVRRLLGAANVCLWRVSEVPDAVLSVSRGRTEVEADGVGGRIPAPPAGTPVLILGDLGLLSREGVAAPQWVAFCRRLATVGARPVAWVPVSPQGVTREAARYAQVHCLGAGDLRPVKPYRCAVQVQWPDDALRRLSPKSAMAKALAYGRKRWDALTRYTGEGMAEIDNNIAERAIRSIAIGRKNWLFAGSKAGGERAAAIYSVIETAKLNGVEPQAYIADVIEKIASGWPASRWGDLMPWNWQPEQQQIAQAA